MGMCIAFIVRKVLGRRKNSVKSVGERLRNGRQSMDEGDEMIDKLFLLNADS